jgi:hypothetical protein
MATTYAPPVDKLLTYGSLQDEISAEWPDYLALGLSAEDIPELIPEKQKQNGQTITQEEQKKKEVIFRNAAGVKQYGPACQAILLHTCCIT